MVGRFSEIMKDFLSTGRWYHTIKCTLNEWNSGCLCEGAERYETSQLFEFRTRARKLAIANARLKAEALCDVCTL